MKNFLQIKNLNIEQIACAVPKEVCSNDQFEEYRSNREIKIFEKTVGIKERRWTRGVKTTNTDLALTSISQLANHLVDEKVKAVLYISQTPNQRIPFVSNIIQSEYKLGNNTLCYDLNLGCAGYVQGLYLAASLLQNFNEDEKVLMVCSETLSRILDLSDNATNMIFGDGAAATLIGRNKETNSYFNLYSDGDYSTAIETKKNHEHQDILHMNGPEVFDFTIREVSASIESLLKSSKIAKTEIDYFVMHQANSFILNQIATQLGLANRAKIINHISQTGNTSSVSIPLALSSEFENTVISGQFLFSGFGSGLNWGNCVVQLDNTIIHHVKEI